MVQVHVFEHDALPVDGVGKQVGDMVVVVLRSGLGRVRRRELLSELLRPSELAVYAGRDGT